MPLIRPPRSMWKDLRELTQYFENVTVAPDDGTTGTDALQDNSVTNAKLRDSAATSVIGRASGSTGDPADIVASNNGEYLRRTAGVLTFGAILDADVPATIARDAEVATAVSTAISDHEAAGNPHPTYLTQAEGDALYPQMGTAETITGAWGFQGNIGFFSTAPTTQPADVGALTDNTTGTANNTLEALPDPADTPADADALRDDLVANLIPALRNNFADLAEQCNAIRATLRSLGLMA